MDENKPFGAEETNEMPMNPITLTDEDGKEHPFNQIDYCKIKGSEYVALVPIIEDPSDLEEFDGQLVIMKVIEKNGSSMLYFIEDDTEFEEVSQIFVDRLSEDFDILDDPASGIEVVE